jgi:hypothetical protein
MIQNQSDWWNLVNENWSNLSAIMARNLPMAGYEDIDHKILTHPLYIEVDKLKQDHDWETLSRYFQAAWAAAPDESWIHSIPGWGVLCDLCSEIWVFEENDSEDLIPEDVEPEEEPRREKDDFIEIPSKESTGLVQFTQLVWDFMGQNPDLEKLEPRTLNKNLAYQAEGGGDYIKAGAEVFLLHQMQVHGDIDTRGNAKFHCFECGCDLTREQADENGKCPNCVDEVTGR